MVMAANRRRSYDVFFMHKAMVLRSMSGTLLLMCDVVTMLCDVGVRLLWLQNLVQVDLLSSMSNNRSRHSVSVMVWYCRSLWQRSPILDMLVCTYFRFGM